MGADPDAKPENATVAAVLRWWGALQLDIGKARASSARLRRCPGAMNALLLDETHDLLKAVRRAGEFSAGERDKRLVALALVLPGVEGVSKLSLARVLGQTADGRPPGKDDRPRLSPARFGALTRAAQARDWDAFVRATRRALAILDDARFDVGRFVRDVLFLNDETLQDWAYEYWQTRAPADAADDQTDSSPDDMDAAP